MEQKTFNLAVTRLWKFAAPLDPSEAALRFRVLEDRDDRVLVVETTLPRVAFQPSHVYLKSDLIPAAPKGE